MVWDVEYTDEFEAWWSGLTDHERRDVSAVVEILMAKGPRLPFPYSSGVEGSKHSNMRELRVQSGGKPLRVFMLSIQGEQQFCLLLATKLATAGSTRG